MYFGVNSWENRRRHGLGPSIWKEDEHKLPQNDYFLILFHMESMDFVQE